MHSIKNDTNLEEENLILMYSVSYKLNLYIIKYTIHIRLAVSWINKKSSKINAIYDLFICRNDILSSFKSFYINIIIFL